MAIATLREQVAKLAIGAPVDVVPFSAVTREGVREADRVLAQWLPAVDAEP